MCFFFGHWLLWLHSGEQLGVNIWLSCCVLIPRDIDICRYCNSFRSLGVFSLNGFFQVLQICQTWQHNHIQALDDMGPWELKSVSGPTWNSKKESVLPFRQHWWFLYPTISLAARDWPNDPPLKQLGYVSVCFYGSGACTAEIQIFKNDGSFHCWNTHLFRLKNSPHKEMTCPIYWMKHSCAVWLLQNHHKT